MKDCPVMMTKLVIATVLSIRKNTSKAMPIRKVIRTVSTQRSMLRLYAKEHHLNVIDEYIDDGWSGTNFVEVR